MARKMEVYDLNWKEKQFIRLLEANGFYYNESDGQISSQDRTSQTYFFGHITHEKPRYSGYLVIYDEFEKRDKDFPTSKETFSKLRKLAEEFEG